MPEEPSFGPGGHVYGTLRSNGNGQGNANGQALIALGPVPGGRRWHVRLAYAGDLAADDPTANINGTGALYISSSNNVTTSDIVDVALALPLVGSYSRGVATAEQGEFVVFRFFGIAQAIRGLVIRYELATQGDVGG